MGFRAEDEEGHDRYSFYKTKSDHLQRVSETSAEYDPLAYVLFFPKGGNMKNGWTPYMPKILSQEELNALDSLEDPTIGTLYIL